MPAPKKIKVSEIVKLWTKEASFVPRGANPGARRMFWKSAGDGAGDAPKGALSRVRAFFSKVFGEPVEKDADPANPPSTADILADRELWNAWYGIRSAFDEACWAIRDSEATDKPARLLQAVQEFAAAVEEAFGSIEKAAPFLEQLDAQMAAFGEQAIEKEAWDLNQFNTMLDLLEKEAKAPGREAPGEEDEMFKSFGEFLGFFKKATPAEKAEFAKEMPKEVLVDLLKEQGGAPAPAAGGAPAAGAAAGAPVPLEKAPSMVKCPDCGKKFDASKAIAKEDINLEDLPAAVRVQLEEGKKTQEKVEKLEKEKLEKECKDEAAGLGLDVEKTSALLFKAQRGEVIKPEELRPLLKSVSEQSKEAQKILLSEKGHNRAAPKADSAEGKLMNIAKAYQEADKKLSPTTAFAKALEDNVELAEQYEREEKAKTTAAAAQ